MVALHWGSLVTRSFSRVCFSWCAIFTLLRLLFQQSLLSLCLMSVTSRQSICRPSVLAWDARRTTHVSFFCLYVRSSLSYCHPAAATQNATRMSVARIALCNLQDAHKMYPALQIWAHNLTSLHIFELSLSTLQTAL